jgi:hypothetical protein
MNDNTEQTIHTWLDQMNGMRDARLLDNPDAATVADLNSAAFAFMEIVGQMSRRAREARA